MLDVVIELGILLLDSREEVAFSATWFLKSALMLTRYFISADSKLVEFFDKVINFD